MSGCPSFEISVGVKVVRGRLPGRRAEGAASSSHIICSRVPRQNPSPGTVGEDCSQPPDGVAEIILPHRSTTSRWQVSPLLTPFFCTVGSPMPALMSASLSAPSEMSGVVKTGAAPSRPSPGRNSDDACSVMSSRREAA